MDKSPEVMAALQAKLDVANERITQRPDEAWSFHHQELDFTIFSPFSFFWRFKHIFIGLQPAFECCINH
jgi:hypothetical protein